MLDLIFALRAKLVEIEKMLDALEAEAVTNANKEYVNQGGPGVDPSQPAPKAHGEKP